MPYRFHGDLLLGGAALRELDGLVEDEAYHAGRFKIDARKQELIELGRPYLLMLDNGKSVPVVVKEMYEEEGHESCVVRFEATNPSVSPNA